MQKFLIGRGKQCNQPFAIASDGVHTEHAVITIDDSGNWMLEDLKGDSGNGTFVRTDLGEWKRVYKVAVTPTTVIRLAQGGHHAYTFMAHRVLQPKDDYGYEIEQVRQSYYQLKGEEEAEEKRLQRLKSLPMIVSAVCLIASFVATNISSVRVIMGSQAIVIGLISYFFGGNTQLRAIREKRRRMVVCPRCQRPMSDFDLENRQCSICKAK